MAAELWRCGGLNIGQYNPTLRFVASPTVAPGLIVVPSAKKGPVLGLSPDGHGDITNIDSDHLWTKSSATPDVPSPLVHDGLVYLCDEGGMLSCFDAATGADYYSKQRTHADRHRASPVYADGKMYIASRDGTVTVVKAGKEFEVLADNDHGRRYLRIAGHLRWHALFAHVRRAVCDSRRRKERITLGLAI